MRASSPLQPTEEAVVGVTLTKQGARYYTSYGAENSGQGDQAKG